MVKFENMSDAELLALVKDKPMAGGGIEDTMKQMKAEQDAWVAEQQRLEEERQEEERDPYRYETPEQAERRGALTDLLGRREEFLGEIDPEQFDLRFDPMMSKLEDVFGQKLRGYEEMMSERGLMPSGSFAGGEEQRIQPSSAYDVGRGQLEGIYAEELGNITAQAQAEAQAQQLQEYMALLSGYGGATVSPAQALSAAVGFEQMLNQMRMQQAQIEAMPDEPSLLEKVLI